MVKNADDLKPKIPKTGKIGRFVNNVKTFGLNEGGIPGVHLAF
jgi:hypothetical protein